MSLPFRAEAPCRLQGKYGTGPERKLTLTEAEQQAQVTATVHAES